MANGIFVSATGTQNIDALLGGTKWNSLSVTFNFPDSLSYYPADYGGSFSIFTNPPTFQTATTAVRSTVNWAIHEQFMKVTNLVYTQVGPTAAADTSIAGVDIPGFGGFGYFPIVPGGSTTAADLQRQGDYWYDSPQTARFANIVRGDNSWRGVMHEIGHTLGLKHGHELGGPANTAMTPDRDSMEFSLMTYRKYVGAPPNGDSFADVERFGAAQTLMMYDIAALQAMYGANYATNAGNTTYTWSTATGEMSIDGVGQGAAGANRIFMTLWDGNGIDTYDLSNYATNLQIDLAPGGWSVFDPAQLSILSVANGIKARGNVFNALLFNGNAASLIENAAGGAGNDIVVGNVGANVLKGGGGADYLFGGGFAPDGSFLAGSGNDSLEGGAGNDGIWGADGNDVLSGGAGNDGIVGGAGNDALSGDDGTDWLFGGDFAADGTFAPNSGNDTLSGGDGNDGLWGQDGNDVINGDAGDDYAEGGLGNDTIAGGADNDTLLGQDGADVVGGGTGFDYLYGGAGPDVFVFNRGDSYDTVWDFSAAEGDRIRLDPTFGVVTLADLQGHLSGFTFEGADYSVIDFPDTVDRLTIKGIAATAWTADLLA